MKRSLIGKKNHAKRVEKKPKFIVKETSVTKSDSQNDLVSDDVAILTQDSAEQINLRTKNALEFAIFSFEREEKDEQNLINKVGLSLGVVSTVLTLLLMATPVMMERNYIADGDIAFFYKHFPMEATCCVLCLWLALFFDFGVNQKNGKEFLTEIENDRDNYVFQSQYDNKRIEILAKAQSGKQRNNLFRFFLLGIGMFSFVLAFKKCLPILIPDGTSIGDVVGDNEFMPIENIIDDFVYPNLNDAESRLKECAFALKVENDVFNPLVGAEEQTSLESDYIRHCYGFAIAHLKMVREQLDRATLLFRESRNLRAKDRRSLEEELYGCEKRYADLKKLSLGIGVWIEGRPEIEKTEVGILEE